MGMVRKMAKYCNFTMSSDDTSQRGPTDTAERTPTTGSERLPALSVMEVAANYASILSKPEYSDIPADILAEIIAEKMKGVPNNSEDPRYRTALRVVSGAVDNYRESGSWKISARGAIVELPMPNSAFRIMPTALLRSSLFTTRGDRIPRQAMENKELFLTGNGWIKYTGIELRQDDATLFMELIRLVQEQRSLQIEISAYALLQALGLTDGGENYKRLHASLTRMQGGVVQLHVFAEMGHGKGRQLIKTIDYKGTPRQRRYIITFYPEIIMLFSKSRISRLDVAQRRELKIEVALWLQGYLATHREPKPILALTIKKVCQTGIKDMYKFHQRLKQALTELQKVGALIDWNITDKGLVVMTRPEPRKKLPNRDLPGN